MRFKYAAGRTNKGSTASRENRGTAPVGYAAQVKFVKQHVEKSGLCIGVIAANGLILVAECTEKSTWPNPSKFNEKIFAVHQNIVCAIAGLREDRAFLMPKLMRCAEHHSQFYGDTPILQKLVHQEWDTKNVHKQTRRFGSSILYMGWNERFGMQLMTSDLRGNHFIWDKPIAIGRNADDAMQLLYDKLPEHKSKPVHEAVASALWVLSKAVGVKELNPTQVEIATVEEIQGGCVCGSFSYTQVADVCTEFNKKSADECASAEPDKTATDDTV